MRPAKAWANEGSKPVFVLLADDVKHSVKQRIGQFINTNDREVWTAAPEPEPEPRKATKGQSSQFLAHGTKVHMH
jgi:hypothetical protein